MPRNMNNYPADESWPSSLLRCFVWPPALSAAPLPLCLCLYPSTSKNIEIAPSRSSTAAMPAVVRRTTRKMPAQAQALIHYFHYHHDNNNHQSTDRTHYNWSTSTTPSASKGYYWMSQTQRKGGKLSMRSTAYLVGVTTVVLSSKSTGEGGTR